MTDLSTTNLKRLLNEATPGPWRHDDEVGEILGAYYEKNGIGYIPSVGYADDYNADLIALAPELAQEVLRLRKGLKAICSDLHESALCNGGTDVPYLQGITEQAVETGRQIEHLLGDHQ